MTEGLGNASRKAPTDLKDDYWRRTTWLYMKHCFTTERFTCSL